MLKQATLSAIKNRTKALIHPNTTVKQAMEYMQKLDESLYKAAYKQLEKEADTLITKVAKMNKSKTKKSELPRETIAKLLEEYQAFSSARATNNLLGMADSNQRLKLFFKEGRDIFKAEVAAKKAETKSIAQEILAEADKIEGGRFVMRMGNSAEVGT